MSTRTILVVFMALVSGAGVAVGVLQSHRPKGTQLATTETEDVLIAIGDIERGEMVTKEDVKITKWPKGYAPADALRTLDKAVGRAAVSRILADEVVRDAKLAKEGAGLGLAPVIPVGMRAMTIVACRVNTNVAGFVLPGSKVDVLLNLRGGRGDDTGGGSTTTLLQAVEILAVDQIQEAPETNQFDPKKLASVTLLVTPEQANVLDLAQNMGTLSFALRNSSDLSDAQVKPATLAEIRGLGLPPLVAMSDSVDEEDEETGALAREPMWVMTDAPSIAAGEPAWIDTMRGTQRGRVVLSER
jgi:pilus assembly protein CpaB